jgi:hypothetical protein
VANKSPYGLKITPAKAQEALGTLAEYVTERAGLVESGKLKTAKEAIVMQHAMDIFKGEVQARVKSPLEELYNRLRFTTVPSRMEDEGITNIGIEGVGRTHLEDDIRVAVADSDALRQWLTDNEKEDIITETVNAQTLAAFLRNRMKENAARVGAMKGVNIDPKALLPMPPPEVLVITPVVRSVIKS